MRKIILLVAAAAALTAAFAFTPAPQASPLIPSGIATQSEALPSVTTEVRHWRWHRRYYHWRRAHWHHRLWRRW
jgi:hypothetical protein